MRNFRLYVILDTAQGRGSIRETARQVIAGGADILQLRAKNCSDEQILKIGRDIKGLIGTNKTLFILNDRADLAGLINADGVHLGQEDLSIQDGRRILGNKKIIGISTHSLEQAEKAEAEGADYIAVGPIFSTATKPGLSPVGTELIREIKDKVKVPFVAIGGINLENISQVLSSGAKRAAVCRAIIGVPDIRKTTEKFRQKLYK